MTTIKAAPRLPFDYAPRFLNQQRRNAIPNRVSQLIDRADQFLVGAHMGERPFAERTYQNYKQTFIHEFSPKEASAGVDRALCEQAPPRSAHRPRRGI